MSHGKLFALKNGRSNIVVDLINYFKIEGIDIVYNDLQHPENYDPEFVKYFPLKKFPAFIMYNHTYNLHFKEDVFKMNEVVAILYCLLSKLVNSSGSKRASEAQRLLTGEIADLQAYGANCKWLCFSTNEFFPVIEILYKMKISKSMDYDEDIYNKHVQKVYYMIEKIIEPELINHCFLVSNNNPSISDLFVVSTLTDFFSIEYDDEWCSKHPIAMDWFHETVRHPMINHRLNTHSF
ncbi:uncharacterized protein HGUI_01041 [Hanseniaspora guilliermondii]|uniref:GST C-terminal domain-containing protein n=1 Tax=Hanseniaspora guilliermondii TaxID=56406 RepID=A0A1L0CKD8_9ASCO|nr:uncharacterized protein HGUI_01041 [Hanseniaspora guilliermondii]